MHSYGREPIRRPRNHRIRPTDRLTDYPGAIGASGEYERRMATMGLRPDNSFEPSVLAELQSSADAYVAQFAAMTADELNALEIPAPDNIGELVWVGDWDDTADDSAATFGADLEDLTAESDGAE